MMVEPETSYLLLVLATAIVAALTPLGLRSVFSISRRIVSGTLTRIAFPLTGQTAFSTIADTNMAAPNTSNFSSVRRKMPPWVPHNAKEAPVLKLYNSLTRQKEVFRPISGNQVKLYICGPTVYDSAHMGHARAYLSFDILRRVLSQYFNYDVLYVMNITDIDDKIIKRARQGYLFDRYVAENHNDSVTVAKDSIKALDQWRDKVKVETDPDKKKMLNEMFNKVHHSATAWERTLKDGPTSEAANECVNFLNSAKDVLSDYLDNQYGDTVNDHSIFAKLAKYYENDFLQDMKLLNVLPPTILTRVSEYIPEIIEYVATILKNDYGYVTSDGSVYFDTARFQANQKHFYAKLVPEAFNNAEGGADNDVSGYMKESEGELSIGADRTQEKKNNSDFALWKASKAGEPFWDSPWGKGRPGWHIECSAMSTSICGDKLDIHAGGFDLKFPHHDNEIAQCEAHFDDPHWVNFFLHCGTLRIAGSKMSKSLKNFISIKNALKEFTTRQLRILFLMHTWNDVLDYSSQTMDRACQFEKVAKEFFLLVKDIGRKKKAVTTEASGSYQKFNQLELDTFKSFNDLKLEIHAALCDSIDTRTVIEKVRAIIVLGNGYYTQTEGDGSTNVELLVNMAEYITGLFKMFGVVPQNNDIGFGSESTSDGVNKEELLMPYLTALADFRETVRASARTQKNTDILNECDRIRDEVLPLLGVRFEDRANQTIVKLEDPETLLREVEQKKAAAQAKLIEKQKREEEARKKAELKLIPGNEWFLRGPDADKYSKLDEKGIPTHLKNGEEVSKKLRSKLEKVVDNQEKSHNAAVKAKA
uniref:Cysteine--tRNA ligase, cytoplasmic n=1 Tax=Panagrellus redivivus TaxID=6233 RepID=A0A7E4W012_PANRE